MLGLRFKNKRIAGLWAAVHICYLCLPVQARASEPRVSAQSEASVDAPPLVNLRVRPLGLLYGILGAEAQLGIARSASVGVSVDWYKDQRGTRSSDAFEYGLLGSVYLSGSRFGGGWLIQPSVRYSRFLVDLSQRDPSTVADRHRWYVETTGGYEWAWKSGFNVHLGSGLALVLDRGSHSVDPVLVWQLGWAI